MEVAIAGRRVTIYHKCVDCGQPIRFANIPPDSVRVGVLDAVVGCGCSSASITLYLHSSEEGRSYAQTKITHSYSAEVHLYLQAPACCGRWAGSLPVREQEWLGNVRATYLTICVECRCRCCYPFYRISFTGES